MTMRKFLAFVFIVFISGSVSAAMPKIGDQGGINQKVDGKKQGKWIYLGKDRPTSGYPAEGKIEEGSYIDDRKEGEWVKYHSDGETPNYTAPHCTVLHCTTHQRSSLHCTTHQHTVLHCTTPFCTVLHSIAPY